MRQVVIAKSNQIKDQTGTAISFLRQSRITFSADKQTEVTFALPAVNAGLIFRLPYELAERGIRLLATKISGNVIKALYDNNTGVDYWVDEQPVLEADLIEQVKYVKVDTPLTANGVAYFAREIPTQGSDSATPAPKKRKKAKS
jgi:hypothetical protein